MSAIVFLSLLKVATLGASEPAVVTEIAGKVVQAASTNITSATNLDVSYRQTNIVSDSAGSQFRMTFADGFQPVSFQSLTPNIATVNEVGETTYVTNGIAKIRIIGQDFNSGQQRGWIVGIPNSVASSTVTNYGLDSFLAGSVAGNISNEFSTRLVGLSFATDKVDVYSTRDYATTNFVRNTNFWLSGVTGLTSVALCSGPSATAISPLHCYAATHYCPSVGATLRFVTLDNSVISRTVIAKESISYVDISILLLDSALPASIDFAKILTDSDVTNKVPCLLDSTWGIDQQFKGSKLPSVTFNQYDRAYVRDLKDLDADNFFSDYSTLWYPDWSVNIISGDSGKPTFLLIDGELVLVGGWHKPIAGHVIGFSSADVNAAMESLSTNHSATVYTLTEYDLSSFNTY